MDVELTRGASLLQSFIPLPVAPRQGLIFRPCQASLISSLHLPQDVPGFWFWVLEPDLCAHLRSSIHRGYGLDLPSRVFLSPLVKQGSQDQLPTVTVVGRIKWKNLGQRAQHGAWLTVSTPHARIRFRYFAVYLSFLPL